MTSQGSKSRANDKEEGEKLHDAQNILQSPPDSWKSNMSRTITANGTAAIARPRSFQSVDSTPPALRR